jgi:hypothetical protein
MQITLYTKPGCHLCEDVKADLLHLQREFGFALCERNIDVHPEDFERYRYLIPVVDIEDGPMLYAPIEPYELHGAIKRVARDREGYA